MAQSTLAVLSPHDFPQVLADQAALDAAKLELGISDGDRLSTPQVRAYLQRALQIKQEHVHNWRGIDNGRVCAGCGKVEEEAR